MEFEKANMDGSLCREITSNKSTNRGKKDWTVEVVDRSMNVHSSQIIEGARGSRHARYLWRIQFPEIRKQFLGKEGYMLRVRSI